MKVLVSGASGFLGKAVVKQLLNAGHEVRVLLHLDKDPDFDSPAIEYAEGDVLKPKSIESALRGCDAVIHLASVYMFFPWWSRKTKAIYKINVLGTRNICEQALKQGIKRFIFTSSIATIGPTGNRKLSNEDTIPDISSGMSHYARSKILAEMEVLKSCARGLPAIILNPAIIIGAEDARPTPSGKMIINYLMRNFPFYLHCILSIADADDVATAHVNALTMGRTGERYILSSDHCSLRTFFGIIHQVSGVKPPFLKVPYHIAISLAYLEELYSLFSGKEPLINTEALKFCKLGLAVDNRKAREELKYVATPLKTTIEKAVDWYRKNT